MLVTCRHSLISSRDGDRLESFKRGALRGHAASTRKRGQAASAGCRLGGAAFTWRGLIECDGGDVAHARRGCDLNPHHGEGRLREWAQDLPPQTN